MAGHKNSREKSLSFKGEYGKDLQSFLSCNKGLIIKIGRNLLGSAFKEEEVISEAALAWWDMSEYKKKNKRTKDTSTYVWFLQKRLEGIMKLDTEEVGKNKYNGGNGNGNCNGDKSADEILLDRYALSEGLTVSQIELDEETKDSGQKDGVFLESNYTICTRSFEGIVPFHVYQVLTSLNLSNESQDECVPFRLTDGRRRSIYSFAEQIRSLMIKSALASGHKLYVVECVNGRYSKILVAGKDKDDATKHLNLKKYGDVVDISLLEMSN